MLAGALLDFGIQPGDRVALISYNRLEWAIIDYATLLVGAVSVPLYSTLPGDQSDYILKDCKAKLLFVEDNEQFDKMESLKSSDVYENFHPISNQREKCACILAMVKNFFSPVVC